MNNQEWAKHRAKWVIEILNKKGISVSNFMVELGLAAGKELFLYDSENGGFDKHDNKDDLLNDTKESIHLYLDDRWDEEVRNVCVGVVLESATQCDRVDRVGELNDEDEDEEGNFFPFDCEYKCNYEINMDWEPQK